MELVAPLRFYFELSTGAVHLFALISGIIFGFLLERAGFGNARKLVEQFYFTDMRMFKVLFSAIITAMLGIYWLSYFRVLDITQIYINGTFLWPQILGGVLFGFGFFLSGLCPGTSCVAVFTGKLDGIAVIGGMIAGIILFGESEPVLGNYLNASSLGDVSIYELLNMNYGFLALLVVIFGVTAFWFAGQLEERFNKKLS